MEGLHAEEGAHAVLHVVGMRREGSEIGLDSLNLPAGVGELEGVGFGSAARDPVGGMYLIEQGEQVEGMRGNAAQKGKKLLVGG